MPIAVSACVICKNEVDRLGLCLDSLLWCADIVVVDSGSTDGTVELANGHAARPRVIRHDWQGYSLQRQFAAAQCRFPWVLMLDADEECSAELAAEIGALTEAETSGIAMYRMPRRNYLGGRYVRCWSPDYQERLIHRDRVRWKPESIPETREALAPYTTATLRRPILHNRLTPWSEADVNDGVVMAERSILLASSMRQRGQKATILNLLARPPSTFFKYYVLRGSFLDGRFGLVIAYKTTIGVILKYSVMYAQEQMDRRPAAGSDSSASPPRRVPGHNGPD